MAYQINLTGKEIDERLQNVGTAKDAAAADGTLYARISKNVDDIDELNDTALHIQDAQTATDKTVTQHTADISTLQTALKTKANLANGKVSVTELPVVTSLGNPNNCTIPSTFAVSRAINDKIVGLLNWQGVKDTTDEIKNIALPKKGDVWHSNEDGSEWVCTEDIFTADHSVWEELGTPIDLSGYYTKNEVDKKVKPLADSIGTDSDAASANSSVYARIKKNQADIVDIDGRQTIIEKVVSVERSNVFFSLPHLLLYLRNYNPSGVYVTLYRWTGKRYHEFEIQRDTRGSFLEVAESYEITLENYGNNGLSYQLAITYADGTKEPLVEALKNAFGGRISHGRRKKRRWRLQAFLNGKPITAPFDFRVSIDCNGKCSLTKEGMMRSVPRASEVVYDGCFSGELWLAHKKGSQFNIVFFEGEKTIKRFPMPGDPVSSTGETYGAVVAVKEKPTATAITYNILWTNGVALYEIGVLEEAGVLSYICSSPAKKLCDDIYDYASKMNSGTLRDLYISAGAKYNEATGFYELNGLTDITEAEMRVIYKYAGTPQAKAAFAYSKARTNLPMPGMYNGSVYGTMFYGCPNLEVAYLGNRQSSPTSYDVPLAYTEGNNCFYLCKKLKKIYGKIYQRNDWSLTFGECLALEEVRIAELYSSIQLSWSPNLSKESVQYMITNAKPLSGAAVGSITITLHPTAYARLKDDADIVAALEAKGGIVTLVSA